LNAKHKTSGLSAVVINQMLMAPQLPPLARAKLLEYIEDKIAGVYGHSSQQVRRFAARLMTTPPARAHLTTLISVELDALRNVCSKHHRQMGGRRCRERVR